MSHLILDTGAFISGATLTSYGPSCVYLTPVQVTQELRDEASLHRFRTFPYPIVTRQPSAEAVQAVTAFAQLTGDYATLSVTDVLVLALVWQVEKEVNGAQFVKERPPAINEAAVNALIHNRGQATTLPTPPPTASSSQLPPEAVFDDRSHPGAEDDGEDQEGEEDDEGGEGDEEEESTSEEEDDGEGQWVTPENLHHQADHSARQRDDSVHPSSVAIITTDYAMQVRPHPTRTLSPSSSSSQWWCVR